MDQLSAAAGSATEVAKWLATSYRNPAAPLGSLRVLVSPSPGDALDPLIAPHVIAEHHRATRDNVQKAVRAFVADCARPTDNVAFVYIAGHGIQLTKHQATVLLEDIGDPETESLWGSIDVRQCHEAMNHAGTAKTQFWFVDACRQVPDIAAKFETMRGGFQLDEGRGEAESSHCFLAAASRQLAFARPGKRTLFCEALLSCLGGEAIVGADPACPDWHVPANTLGAKLRVRVGELARAEHEIQTVHHISRGLSTNAVLHRLARAPRVDVRIELEPGDAAPITTPSLRFASSDPVPDVPAEWPIAMQLDAGLYTLELSTKAPYHSRPPRVLNVVPPSHLTKASVA